MAATTILNRVRSIVVSSPFALTETIEPFDFDRTPSTIIGTAVRVQTSEVATFAGLSYSEERHDLLTLWVAARTTNANVTVQTLHTLANSLQAAVIRDGAAGDYAVLDDGRGADVQQTPGSSYLTGRITLPVSYMVQV